MPDRRRLGFGIIEIVVLLAIASIVALLTLPGLLKADRVQRAQETLNILDATRLRLYNTTAAFAAFRQIVGANASRVSQLVILPINGDDNSCGANFSGGQRGNWPDAGPYGLFTIVPAVGLPTPIGIGNDLMVRNPAGGGGATGTLAIVFPNVDLQDVLVMDSMSDNGDGAAAGLIRWTTVGLVTNFSYTMTIDGTC